MKRRHTQKWEEYGKRNVKKINERENQKRKKSNNDEWKTRVQLNEWKLNIEMYSRRYVCMQLMQENRRKKTNRNIEVKWEVTINAVRWKIVKKKKKQIKFAVIMDAKCGRKQRQCEPEPEATRNKTEPKKSLVGKYRGEFWAIRMFVISFIAWEKELRTGFWHYICETMDFWNRFFPVQVNECVIIMWCFCCPEVTIDSQKNI